MCVHMQPLKHSLNFPKCSYFRLKVRVALSFPLAGVNCIAAREQSPGGKGLVLDNPAYTLEPREPGVSFPQLKLYQNGEVEG